MGERSEITYAQILQRISKYVDSELPPNEAHDVSEHLHGCAECQHEEEAFRGLWNPSSSGPKPHSDKSFLNKHLNQDSLKKRMASMLL